MENWKQIERTEVWTHILAGEDVMCAVIRNKTFRAGIYCLRERAVGVVDKLIADENAVFFKEVNEEV